MRTIVFSFDDGRLDTYSVALPILKQHGFLATINITTDYIANPDRYTEGSFKNTPPMSVEQICEAAYAGHEIASHGHEHKNTVEDINRGIATLESWGLKYANYGFASPYSALREKQVGTLVNDGLDKRVGYIRSGIQVRREGLLFAALFFLMEKTKTKFLYYFLNRNNLVEKVNHNGFYKGIMITNETTLQQLIYLINHMKDESGVLLIFHSITEADDSMHRGDRWCWDKESFEGLCKFLSGNRSVSVKTTKEFLNVLGG